MYDAGSVMNKLIDNINRRFKAEMAFGNGDTVSDNIITVEGTSDIPGNDIAPGMVISQSVTVMLAENEVELEGRSFILHLSGRSNVDGRTSYAQLEEYQYIELEEYTYLALSTTDISAGIPLPMGRFTVGNVSRQGGSFKVDAYDGLYACDGVYTHTTPASSSVIEADICSKLGIRYNANKIGFSVMIPSIPQNTTMRDMLGYIAALDGGRCAMLDREGYLIHKKLTAVQHTVERARADEPTTQTPVKYTRLVCRTSDKNTYSVVPSPESTPMRAVSFYNPYMNPSILSSFAASYINYGFTPLDVNYKMADPRLDMLDIVNVETASGNYAVPLTDISWKYDTGFSGALKASASAAQQSSGPISRAVSAASASAGQSDAQISQLSADLAALAQKLDRITGESGGYVIQKYNASGQPLATWYTDSPDPSETEHILRLGSDGVSASTDGENFAPVIGIDGSIPANRILPLSYAASSAADILTLSFGTLITHIRASGLFIEDTVSQLTLTMQAGSVQISNSNGTVISADSTGKIYAEDISIKLADGAAEYISLRDYINDQ